MRTRRVIGCALGALLCCCLLLGPVAARASAATLAGHVRTTTSGTAISDVTVDVLAANGSTLVSATSALDGSYSAVVSAGT